MIPPLVHPSLTPWSAMRVTSTSTPPLVVVASIGPPMPRPTMPPLVVSVLMRPVSPLTSMPPFTVEKSTSAAAGTFTV